MKSDVPSLAQQIREDRDVHGSWSHPGFHAVAVHRVGAWRWGLPTHTRKLVSALYRLASLWIRNSYGIVIPSTVQIGRRVEIPYGGKVVISGGVVIGDDCILRHNVTIGAARREEDVPTLGRHVAVGTGAVILGKITIGDHAEIGPNAIVLTNVPENGTVFSDPSRVMVAPRAAWDEMQEIREKSNS
jgi:serine O-acetyltransferase